MRRSSAAHNGSNKHRLPHFLLLRGSAIARHPRGQTCGTFAPLRGNRNRPHAPQRNLCNPLLEPPPRASLIWSGICRSRSVGLVSKILRVKVLKKAFNYACWTIYCFFRMFLHQLLSWDDKLIFTVCNEEKHKHEKIWNAASQAQDISDPAPSHKFS